MATAIGITMALPVDSFPVKFPPKVDKLDIEELDDDGAKEGCLGCTVVALSSSLLTSIPGSELVLVSGLRMEDSTNGELVVRPRSIVFLLGIGTGFLTTLESDSFISAVVNDNDADTSGTLLLPGFFKVSADVVLRRLAGNGGASTCSAEAVVVAAGTV